VTFNIQDGEGLSASAGQLMDEWGADAAAFEECGGGFGAQVRALEGWYNWTTQGVCMLSRFRILDTRVMPADVIQKAGGSGMVSSHLLEGDDGLFWLTIVHLGTPRAGLELIRRGSPLEGIRLLRRDSFLREIEHGQAARFADVPGARIVLGDFNAPPESRILRAQWRGWTNAFSVAGFGIGGTRLNGWIRARIDHVLVDDSWKVVSARPGRDYGSDHLPMVATVRRR
jgi:endonuclease/exonuclease/phosphatase family metal-dependent hydrolase